MKSREGFTFFVCIYGMFFVIICNCAYVNVSAIGKSFKIENVNDIPRDWTGKYNG